MKNTISIRSKGPGKIIIVSLLALGACFAVQAASCHVSAPWSWNYCSSWCPCSAGEGDCDTNDECITGYCSKDAGAKYGQYWETDVCEDITPPLIYSLGPSGNVKTNNPSLSFKTNESADCKYDTQDKSFSQMRYSFENTGGKDHNSSVGPLDDGSHTYYVRCEDEWGNENYYSAKIVFSVGLDRTIDLLFPKGGEILRKGNSYEIRWESSNVKSVGIKAYKGSTDLGLIAYGISADSGSYQWDIASDFGKGSFLENLTLRIFSAEQESVFDENDSGFSIKENCHTSSLWSLDYCTPSCPCNPGEGDCDSDSDCVLGKCSFNVGEKYGQISTYDVCERLEDISCHTTSLWSLDYCTPSCPCSAGEGDCDSDEDCSTGYCALNTGAEYGQISTLDVCKEKPVSTGDLQSMKEKLDALTQMILKLQQMLNK